MLYHGWREQWYGLCREAIRAAAPSRATWTDEGDHNDRS
jgi:hypothetical protein